MRVVLDTNVLVAALIVPDDEKGMIAADGIPIAMAREALERLMRPS